MAAVDWFDDRRVWDAARPPMPSFARTDRRAISQLVAHLTYGRRRYALLKEWKWRVTRLHNHLVDCATAMKRALAPGRRGWLRVPPQLGVDINLG